MKIFYLFCFQFIVLINTIINTMELDINPRQRRINILKENPDKIATILKEKKCWHSCFYAPNDIEEAEEAQQQLTDDTAEIRLLKNQNLNQRIVSFSPYQIKLLKDNQLGDLSLETLNILKQDQLKALTENKVEIILKKLNFLIDYNNSESIKSSLIFMNKINEIFNSATIKNLIFKTKKSIYQNLTAERLKDVSNELKTNDIIKAIEEHFNDSIESELKNTLTDHFLKNPNNFDLNAIKYLNIEKINPFEISKLTPEYIKHLRHEQIKNLTDEQIEALTDRQIHAFSKDQLMNLPSNQVSYLISSKKVSLNQIQHIPPKIFSLINPKTIENLSLEQLDALTDNQIQELPNSIKMSLLKKLINIPAHDDLTKSKIKNIITRINNTITYLSNKYFNYYNETLFKELKNKVPSLKFFAQLHVLTIDEIKALTQEKFESLDNEEKNQIFQEIEDYYQLIVPENITHTLNQYNCLDIQNFIYNLANQKDKKISGSIEDSTQDSTKNLTENINEIKKMNDNEIKIINDEGYSNEELEKEIYKTLSDYYKNSSYQKIQEEFQDYKSYFVKKILIRIMNKKSANISPTEHSRANARKIVTIDTTKNILHSPREASSNNDSNSNPTKNTTSKPQVFYAKSTTDDQVTLLNNDRYNKLINDIKEHYKDKDVKAIMNDIKFYRSKNLQLFLWELIGEKNTPKKTKVPKVLNSRTSLDSSFPSSQAAKSSSDNTQTSTEGSNNSLDENFFHRPQ